MLYISFLLQENAVAPLATWLLRWGDYLDRLPLFQRVGSGEHNQLIGSESRADLDLVAATQSELDLSAVDFARVDNTAERVAALADNCRCGECQHVFALVEGDIDSSVHSRPEHAS